MFVFITINLFCGSFEYESLHKQEASKLNNTVVLEPSPNLSPKMATLFGDGAGGIANSRLFKAANITLMTFTPFKHAFGQCRDARGLKMKKGETEIL